MEGVDVDPTQTGHRAARRSGATSSEPPTAAHMTELWVPTAVVQQRAVELSLSPRMLRRLSAAGLLAPCRQRGSGYGRGSAWYYPARALTQLEAVANARPHRVSPGLLRHLVWWQPGGELEDWDRWRRDRVEDLRPSAPAWALEPAFNDKFPEDREQAVVELATWLGSRQGRLPGHARKLRNQGDRETLMRWFCSLVLKDDLLTGLAGAEDVQEARARLQAILHQPVDGEQGEEAGRTFGELLERGLGPAGARRSPGAPGELVVALFGFLPNPQDAANQMASMSESQAGAARDALIAWSARAGRDYGAQLRASPPLAGLMTLWWNTMGSHVPAVWETLGL